MVSFGTLPLLGEQLLDLPPVTPTRLVYSAFLLHSPGPGPVVGRLVPTPEVNPLTLTGSHLLFRQSTSSRTDRFTRRDS